MKKIKYGKMGKLGKPGKRMSKKRRLEFNRKANMFAIIVYGIVMTVFVLILLLR